jgi:putative transposase
MLQRAHQLLPPKPPRSRRALRWHVGDTAIASIMGEPCVRKSCDKNGFLFETLSLPKRTINLTFEEFDLLKDGYEFDIDHVGATPEKAAAVLHSDKDMIASLDKEEQELVANKVVAIQRFLALQARGAASRYRQNLGPVLKKMQTELFPDVKARGGRMGKPTFKIVGPKRFLEWVDAYLEKGPLGLVNQHFLCGRYGDRYGQERPILMDFVYRYLSREAPTIADLYRDMDTEFSRINRQSMVAAGLDLDDYQGIELGRVTKDFKEHMDARGVALLTCPAIDLLRVEIRRLPPFDVIAARKGEEAALRWFHPSKGGVQGLTRPMERVEADDWKTHLHTLVMELRPIWDAISPELRAEAPKKRCTFSAAICCTTRVIPAMTLSLTGGASNTKQLLRMSMMDKTALARSIGCETPWEYRATMGTFVIDEGTPLLNVQTQFICTDLGIALKSPQINTPQQRPKIERFFQTLDIRGLLRFSGRAFSNPQVRGKYESLARTCVTVEELAALIVRFVVDVYHNSPHAGLGGETPRACWLRLTKTRAPWSPPGPNRIRLAFGEKFTSTLQAQGIEIFGNWYSSPLTDWLFQKVPQREYAVKVDGEDLGAISILVTTETEDGRKKEEWKTVVGPEVMKGVSVSVWEAVLADLRRQNQDLQNLVKPVVHRAIEFAQKGDAETRKRLSILYRPKTREELEALRVQMNQTVRYRKAPLKPQEKPIDVLARRIPVGNKAPLPDTVRVTPRPEKPVKGEAAAKPAKTKRPKPAKPRSAGDVRPTKPPRAWKPKVRK